MIQFIKFEKEVFRDFRSIEARRKMKQVNQETDGIDKHQVDCFMQALYGNGEASEGGAR
jgi:hypothetical protein